MPLIAGVDYRSVPPDYCAHSFRNQLKASSSAKIDCRHNADGSHHFVLLPEPCLVDDTDKTHFVNVHIGVDGIPNRESQANRVMKTTSNSDEECEEKHLVTNYGLSPGRHVRQWWILLLLLCHSPSYEIHMTNSD
jgi:hypothetical protein